MLVIKNIHTPDLRKMELIDCLNEMWTCFISAAIIHKEEEWVAPGVEKFLEVKDRAHKLICEI